MALVDVTPDELSIAIQRVGAGEAAKLGYFHALPYGDGGSGGGEGLMLEAHVLQSDMAPRGVGLLRYVYPTPRVNGAVVDILILDAEPLSPDSLTYDTVIRQNDGVALDLSIRSRWYDENKTDDLPAFDQHIGLRIVEFKPSVQMVDGLVI